MLWLDPDIAEARREVESYMLRALPASIGMRPLLCLKGICAAPCTAPMKPSKASMSCHQTSAVQSVQPARGFAVQELCSTSPSADSSSLCTFPNRKDTA